MIRLFWPFNWNVPFAYSTLYIRTHFHNWWIYDTIGSLLIYVSIQRSYDYWRFKYTSDREKCALDCFHLNKHNERGDLLTYILIVIVKFIETQSQILRFQHGLHFPIRQKANHYCISICSENIIVVVWEKFSTRHP